MDRKARGFEQGVGIGARGADPDFQPTNPSLTMTATVGELGPNPVRHLARCGTAMLAARLYAREATNQGVKCVAYWLAQLSSQLRLDLQGAFTTSKPPTLNRSRARLSNSLVRPDRYGLKRQTPATIGAAVGRQ